MRTGHKSQIYVRCFDEQNSLINLFALESENNYNLDMADRVAEGIKQLRNTPYNFSQLQNSDVMAYFDRTSDGLITKYDSIIDELNEQLRLKSALLTKEEQRERFNRAIFDRDNDDGIVLIDVTYHYEKYMKDDIEISKPSHKVKYAFLPCIYNYTAEGETPITKEQIYNVNEYILWESYSPYGFNDIEQTLLDKITDKIKANAEMLTFGEVQEYLSADYCKYISSECSLNKNSISADDFKAMDINAYKLLMIYGQTDGVAYLIPRSDKGQGKWFIGNQRTFRNAPIIRDTHTLSTYELRYGTEYFIYNGKEKTFISAQRMRDIDRTFDKDEYER